MAGEDMSGGSEYPIFMRPERPSRGPRPAYSRGQITEAAIRVADTEGLDAASMRRIAAEIGAGAMSLYRYVPSREDLIELMYDHVFGEIDVPERPSGDWRADLTAAAGGVRAMWLRHRWLADLARARPTFGPNQLRMIEFTHGALDIGIPIDDIMGHVGMVLGFAEAAARNEIGWARELERTGMTREDWMGRTSPYIRKLLDSGDHPMLERIVRDARQPHLDHEQHFRYNLDRMLDYIAAVLPN